MEFHQLRYFIAAAEAGSMTLASKRCSVAQPSLSQQIRKLEESLGVVLFDRLGRGVVLTDAGRALLPRARRIVTEVKQTQETLQSEAESGVGRLAIGAIPTIAPYVLPAVLAALRAEFPLSEMEIREDFTERLIEQVVDHVLDVAIVSTPVEHEHIDVRVLGEERLLVVSAADGEVGSSGYVTLESLRGLPRVSLHEMHCLGRQIDGFCALRKLGSHVVCHAAQMSTLLELVRLGLGVSLVPEMAAKHDITGERRYTPLRRQGPVREIAMVTRSGRSRGVMVERAGELVGKVVGQTQAGRLCHHEVT